MSDDWEQFNELAVTYNDSRGYFKLRQYDDERGDYWTFGLEDLERLVDLADPSKEHFGTVCVNSVECRHVEPSAVYVGSADPISVLASHTTLKRVVHWAEDVVEEAQQSEYEELVEDINELGGYRVESYSAGSMDADYIDIETDFKLAKRFTDTVAEAGFEIGAVGNLDAVDVGPPKANFRVWVNESDAG